MYLTAADIITLERAAAYQLRKLDTEYDLARNDSYTLRLSKTNPNDLVERNAKVMTDSEVMARYIQTFPPRMVLKMARLLCDAKLIGAAFTPDGPECCEAGCAEKV